MGRRHRKRKERIQDIKAALAEGTTSANEIAARGGISPSYVHRLCRQEQIKLHGVRRKRDDELSLARIIAAFNDGAGNPHSLRWKSGIQSYTALRLCREYDVSVPDDFQYSRRRKEPDGMVRRGLSLGEMVELRGKTRQAYSAYIEKSGQHEFWSKRREERLSREKEERFQQQRARQSIYQLLIQIISKKCAAQGPAYEKAWEYYLGRERVHSGSHSWKELFGIFDAYYHAKERKAKLSLEGLAEGIRSRHSGQAWRVLNRVGLKAMHRNRIRKIRRGEKKAEVERAYRGLPHVPYTDVAYFLNLSSATVSLRYQKLGGRGIRAAYLASITKERGGHGVDHLTYRDASRFLEARDAGYTPEETAYLLDRPRPLVQYTLAHEQEISLKIRQLLRTVYPAEEITAPYRKKK